MKATFQSIGIIAVFTLLSSPAYCTESPPVRPITAGECVEAALRNNIDIAVSRTEREIAEQGVPIEEAAFLPRFKGELGNTRSLSPSDSSLTGGLSIEQKLLKFTSETSELLSVGASVGASYEFQRQELNNAYTRLSPEYTSSLTFSLQVPLLKNRGKEVTEAPLFVAQAGAASKTKEWEAKAMDTVASARSAFLAFYSASREVEVRDSAVALALTLLRHIDARINAGAAASMDRLPAEAAVAARKEELLRAQAAVRSAEDDLKSVMGVRTGAGWEEHLVPVPPEEKVPSPGPEETFEEAMRRRPEVEAFGQRILQGQRQEAVAKNRTLPAVDLTSSAGLTGLAGTPNTNPLFGSSSSSSFEGDGWTSVGQMLSIRHYNWFVGIKTEIPWRFDRERAEWKRAQAALSQQRLLAEGVEATIRLEVHKGRRDLESGLARIDAARLSVEAARKKLEAEEAKLSLGRSTVAQVLQFQQDVSEARLTLIRAQADAYLAQTRLRRAVGTIIEKEGIVLR